MRQTLLIELGTEELPPKLLKPIAERFAANFNEQLTQHNLAHGDVLWYSSPRRLALKVAELSAVQPKSEFVRRGPAIHQAFDADGKPTKAAEGWAHSCGISLEQAQKQVTNKGEWLTYTSKQQGQSVTALLGAMIEAAIIKLPISKAMRWSDKAIEFIRPVHTLTTLYGDKLIPCSILGIKASRTLLGHRFMGEQKITINQADDYPEILEKRGKVIADYQQRRSRIQKAVTTAAAMLNGVADLTEDLLDEVTSLVEWPVVLVAKFEEKFLNVPAEVLVYTMKNDQKYFPVYDKANGLLPHFIFVANIESRDPNIIIRGNEKVIRPRLADAEFFYRMDLKKPLEARLPALATRLFQQKLGSMRDKSERIALLAEEIAQQIKANSHNAKRAGLLCKCDLMTNVVFEFPETQGVMGMYLARHDKEDESVATAISQHYLPKFAGDHLPTSLVALSVAIADKMDTLVGIFGVGQYPKGDKDPFALRRTALGILRILIENALPLDLNQLAASAEKHYDGMLTNKNVITVVVKFMQGRFRSWDLEQGADIDTIQAVLATHPSKPTDFDARIKAVSYFRTLDASSTLTAANKRVANILSKANENIPGTVNMGLLKDKAEIDLAQSITTLKAHLAPYLHNRNYKQILIELSTLKQPIDAFFEQVMVMVDDAKIKQNRLALLKQLQNLFLHVADISLLQS